MITTLAEVPMQRIDTSSPWGGFLMKDIMFLGAALVTGSEALSAVPAMRRRAHDIVAA